MTTQVKLVEPARGKLDVTALMPAMTEHARSLGSVSDADLTRIVSNMFTLTAVGVNEFSDDDCVIVMALFEWLSSKLPRTKFHVQLQVEEGARTAYDFRKGVKSPHDPRKQPKKASKEVSGALDSAEAKKYSAIEHFEPGDVVEHPSFGRGLVTKLADNKVVVQFRDAERMLVHARA